MIREPARSLPVSDTCDVLVAGGGVAGVAAAVAAARAGARVCLLEKASALGGLATLGNVTIWLPLCDGRGRQVMAGLTEEMLHLSVADLSRDHDAARFRRPPACWAPGGTPAARAAARYVAEFNPFSCLLALEKLTVDAGVRLLYDTRLCAVRRTGRRITHAMVENKSGRSAIACRTAVDATGDADLCHLAGERTESLDSNVLCGWFYHLESDGLHLHQMTNAFSPEATREGATGPFFRGDDAGHVTAHLLATRDLIRARLGELRRNRPREDIQIIGPPTIACFRMTRRLVAGVSLGERHRHRWFADTIGLTGDWRRAGPVYPIPLRALRAVRTRNLLAAGRCLSADTTVWDVTRAIPTCALTGEAAGTAAALAVQTTGGDVHALDVAALQERLRRQGMLLERELARPAAAPRHADT